MAAHPSRALGNSGFQLVTPLNSALLTRSDRVIDADAVAELLLRSEHKNGSCAQSDLLDHVRR
jgi:hypothetical protein